MSKKIIKTNRYDFWLADGTPDFGVIKGGSTPITERDAPIRLQRGDQRFGCQHIASKHARWVASQKLSVPELVWKKCRHSGNIWCTEETAKYKIWLPLPPAGLLILRFVSEQSIWAVVTLYPSESSLDGKKVGRYEGGMFATVTALNSHLVPTFSIIP